MPDTGHDHAPETQRAQEPRYPTNHVVAVIDTEVPLAQAVESLTSGGFLDTEIQVACGNEMADRLKASAGRGGLTGVAIRVAQRLGLEDDEMSLKTRYEQALRDGSFVLLVAAPTADRKERAAELLRQHGAHSIHFLGRFLIEGMDSA